MRIWKKYIVENDIAVIERRLEKKKSDWGVEYDSEQLGIHELEKSQWLKTHEKSEQLATVIG